MTWLPLNPIPLKDRVSMIFLQYGQIDVIDGAFVLIDKTGIRTHIPVGSVACIMLEPGTRVSHAAVRLAAQVGTLLVWVGEAGVRVYASGQPGGARSDKLLYQAKLALDEDLRLKVVRKMFELRFGEPAPARRSVEQLRGIEGSRVRATYALLAKQYGVTWNGRRYDPKDWEKGDTVNQCISAATSCLYGVTEAAILAAGYAPAIGQWSLPPHAGPDGSLAHRRRCPAGDRRRHSLLSHAVCQRSDAAHTQPLHQRPFPFTARV